MSARRRVAVAAGVTAMTCAAVLAPAGSAGADPPGPTDYKTTVVGVEPATPTIHVTIIGGDSFVQLAVDRGTQAVVLGYSGEPYLRFGSDGTVEENGQSPTVAQNKDRYGNAPAAGGDAAAAPEWTAVAHDGTYAWHDHRAHWMSPDAPPGFERGQRIQDGTIPLEVDGVAVTISVSTAWMEAPSPVPLVAGAILAVFALMTVLSMRRRIAWAVVVAATAASAVGWVQVNSVPEATGPSTIWWVLPVSAGISTLLALALGRSLISHALVLLAGVQLTLWVVLRRDGLTRSILPTDAPFWLDRGVTTGVAVIGVIALAGSLLAMFRQPVEG